jgi:hypothetical protein
MSETVTLNGTSHVLPTRNENIWGASTTTFLEVVALAVDGTFQTVTVTGANTTVNFALGKNVRLVLGASTTLAFSNPRAGQTYKFYVKQGGSWTLAWPGTVKWPTRAPTITTGAGAIDLIELTYDATDTVYLGRYWQGYA